MTTTTYDLWIRALTIAQDLDAAAHAAHCADVGDLLDMLAAAPPPQPQAPVIAEAIAARAIAVAPALADTGYVRGLAGLILDYPDQARSLIVR